MYPRPSPAVVSSDGGVVSYDDSGTVVDGVYPVPWSVVAVYHTEGGHGWTVMRKGWFWWRDAIRGGVSLEQGQPDDDVAYGIETPFRHVSDDQNDPTNGLRWGQLLAGRRTNSAAQGVRVRFDDGFTQEVRINDEHFAVFVTDHGAACELTTIGTNGEIMQTVRLEAFVDTFFATKGEDPQILLARLGFDTTELDCAG
jgi:hypothetical protein